MTMFRNLTIFRALGMAAITDAAAQPLRFTPCAAHEDRSLGWTPPREFEHGSLVETVGEHTILTVTLERKRVPGDALRRALDDRCRAIQDQEGFKPGRKRRQQLKDDIRTEMLAHAIPTRTAVRVWIDRDAGMLAVGATGSTCDDVVTLLVRSFDGLALSFLMTVDDPQKRMSGWLAEQGGDDRFLVGRDADLVSLGAASVRLRDRDLYGSHAADLLAQGMRVSRLELHHEAASFLLAPTLELRRIRVDVPKVPREEGEDAFDGDVTIECGALRAVIRDLVAAFGGAIQGEAADA